MTNTTQTILLTESGDLDVYDYRKPEKSDGLLDNFNAVYNHWLSTKRTVKMAEGHRKLLLAQLYDTGIGEISYPIDVSDIVEIRDGLGYFKEPVVEDIGIYSFLIDLVVKNYGKSKGEVINIIQEHFEIKRK